MTNEEYALEIKSGNTELYEKLWDRVKNLIFKISCKYYLSHNEKCVSNGITQDDLFQAGFIALVETVKDYNPEKGYLLTSYLTLHIKNVYSEMLGCRTSKRDMLETCASLDVPIDKESGITYQDTVADPENKYAESEDKIFNQQLSAALSECVENLPEELKAVIKGKYYDNLTLTAYSKANNINRYRARDLEFKALRYLRQGNAKRILEPYADMILGKALHSTGFNAFNNNQASSVELTAEYIEKF